MLKAIIFDMDGVLVDSSGGNGSSFVKAFQEYGIDISGYNKKEYLGRSLADQLVMWREEFNITQDIVLSDLSEKALKYQLEYLVDILKPNEHVQNLINEAKNRWIKLAVATSSTHKRAVALLNMVGVYVQIDVFVTCEDVVRSKPAPDIFLKAAEHLGIDPKCCLVIEDALNGIQAAQTAEMKSAGKIGKYHTAEELSIADIVFTDFSEICLEDLERVFI